MTDRKRKDFKTGAFPATGKTAGEQSGYPGPPGAGSGDLEEYLVTVNGQGEEIRRTRVKMNDTHREYANLYDYAPVGYATFNREGVVLRANFTLAGMFEIQHTMLQGSSFRALVAPEDRDEFLRHLKEVRETGASRVCELWLGKTGKMLCARLQSVPARTAPGEEWRCHTVIVDITVNRRLFEQLEENQTRLLASESRYRAVIEDLPALICRYTPDFVILFVNRAYANYFGKKPEEMVGFRFLASLPESEREKVVELHRALTPESPMVVHEHMIIAPGGEIRWQKWTNRALFRGGRIAEYQSIGEDITEEKRAEQQVYFQARLLESVGQAVVAKDWEGKILYWNRAAERMYDWTAEEAIGENIYEMIVPEESQVTAREIIQTLRRGEPWTGEAIVQRRDGSRFPIFIFDTPLLNDRGEHAGIIGVHADISREKGVERVLREREEMLRLILAHSPDTMFFQDRDLRYVWSVNPTARLPEKLIIGKTDDDFSGVVNKSEREAVKRSVIETGEPRYFEVLLRKPDGSERWQGAVYVPRRDEEGNILGIFGYSRDITEVKRAMQRMQEFSAELDRKVRERTAELEELYRALHDERETLQSIVDNIPVMITFFEPDRAMRTANREFERLTGWSVNEIRSMNIMEALFPDRKYRKKITEYMEAAPKGWMDQTLRIKNGGKIESSWANMRLSDGSLIGIGIDITGRKRAEAELARYRERLEDLVKARTAALMETNRRLEEEIAERVQAEEAQRVSEERFRLALSNSRTSVYTQDRDLRYTWLFHSNFGLSTDEVRGKSYRDLYPPEEAALQEGIARRVMETGRGEQGEIILSRNGAPRFFHYTMEPLREASGNISGVIGAATDITGIGKAYQALRRSERKYRSLVKNANSIILRYAPDGKILYLNDFGLRFFAWRKEEIVGRCIMKIIPGKEHEPFNQAGLVWDVVKNTQRFRNFEQENIRENGVRVTVAWTNTPIYDDKGNLVEILAIGNDITGLKRAENALRLSEERYRAVSELMSDFAFLFRTGPGNYAVLEWIAGPVERISGYSLEELKTLGSWTGLIYPEDRDRVMKIIRAHITEPRESTDEYRAVTKQGEVRWFRVYSHSVWDEKEGRVVLVYGAARDITERRRLEENITRLRKEQEAFLAHEVKNLLIPLHVYAESLLLSTENLSGE
ncbi:MAG: PAS domain S-box protein, partial [Candidatus Latescibacterota bacterium]